MSLLHFFYGAGSILGPRGAGFFIERLGFNWRQVYVLVLPLTLIVTIPVLFSRFSNAVIDNSNTTISQKQPSFIDAVKTPMVWIFSLTLGFMEVVELSTANWGGLYFQDVYNLDPRVEGASFVANFYILFTVSRLVSGFAIEKIGYIKSLYIASVATALLFLTGFLLGARGILALPILGFFVAIMWPTFMAIAMGFFGPSAPIMTTAIIVISGAINAGSQLLIGLVNRFAGAAWGYRCCFVYALFLIASLPLLRRNIGLNRAHIT
jgi:fucose permease